MDLSKSRKLSIPTAISITGLAAKLGTEVLPICSILGFNSPMIVCSSFFIRLNILNHSGLCFAILIFIRLIATVTAMSSGGFLCLYFRICNVVYFIHCPLFLAFHPPLLIANVGRSLFCFPFNIFHSFG